MVHEVNYHYMCVIDIYLIGCVQNTSERTGKNLRVAASGKSLGGHQLGKEGDQVFTGHCFVPFESWPCECFT